MRIRLARPGEEIAVGRIRARGWQAAYRGIVPDSYLDSIDPADWASRHDFGDGFPDTAGRTVLVVDDAGVLCGFSSAGLPRDEDLEPPVGELYAIYLDPDWIGTGAGRRLMPVVRRHLSESGFTEAVLWVVTANDQARRFYERDGWTTDAKVKTFEVDGVEIEEVRYRRRL